VNKKGYVLLVMVLILASVFAIVIVKLSIQSIVMLKNSSLNISQATLANLTRTCAHDNLIHLTRNVDYSGETLSIFSGTCTSTVTTNGSYKNINMAISQGTYYDALTITFDPIQKKL